MGVCLVIIGCFDIVYVVFDWVMLLDFFLVLIYDFKGVMYYFVGEYDEVIVYFRCCFVFDFNFYMLYVNWVVVEFM